MGVRSAVQIAFLGILSLCCSCTRTANDPQMNLKDGPVSAVIYADGRPGKSGVLSSNSAPVELIEKLIDERKGHWRTSSVSYAPVVLIRGSGFQLNVQKDKMIANIDGTGEHPLQVVSGLTSTEYEQIRQSVAESLEAADEQ